MSEGQPVISGQRLVRALERAGWTVARQRGGHARLTHPDRTVSLIVPLDRELKRGTLAGILRDAGLDNEELRLLL